MEPLHTKSPWQKSPAAGMAGAGQIVCAATPATGGSGGGPNKDIYPSPEPLSILGLNSTVVYGTNVQVAFPLNFQLALGANLQVCISPNAGAIYDANESIGSGPVAMYPTMPPGINRWLGSGFGGNMQMTMGTSANFVIGQVFDINLGPRRITLDVHTVTGIQSCIPVVGKLIIAATWVFVIGYVAIPNDDARSIFVMAFQVAMQAMMYSLMDTQGIYGQMDVYYQNQLNTIFAANPMDPQLSAAAPAKPAGSDVDRFLHSFDADSTIGAHAKTLAIVFALVTPVLLEILGEIKLDNPPPPDMETYNVQGPEGHETVTVPSS